MCKIKQISRRLCLRFKIWTDYLFYVVREGVAVVESIAVAVRNCGIIEAVITVRESSAQDGQCRIEGGSNCRWSRDHFSLNDRSDSNWCSDFGDDRDFRSDGQVISRSTVTVLISYVVDCVSLAFSISVAIFITTKNSLILKLLNFTYFLIPVRSLDGIASFSSLRMLVILSVVVQNVLWCRSSQSYRQKASNEHLSRNQICM